MTNGIESVDENAVFSLKGKNMDTFDFFFRQFYKPLCLFACRIIHDRYIAQDIVQDVFVKFWQKEILFDETNAVRAYLYTGVRNACYNQLEKLNVRSKYIETLKDTDIEEATVLNEIIQAEVLRQVFAAIDTLPEQCRKIIRMTFEEDKKAKDIASELGVTISTVNNQKMRGLTLLKTRLSDNELGLGLLLLLPNMMVILGSINKFK